MRKPTSIVFWGAMTVLVALLSAASTAQTPPATGDLTVPDALNMHVVGHADLTLLGEGMAEKITPDGKRIFYVAHESGPQCFAVLDVTDAAHPTVLEDIPSPGKDFQCTSAPVRRTSRRSGRRATTNST